MLEQQGVPTVVIGTKVFEGLAKLEAKNRGLEGLAVVLVDHPLGGIKEDEVMRRADAAVDLVVKAVTAS